MIACIIFNEEPRLAWLVHVEMLKTYLHWKLLPVKVVYVSMLKACFLSAAFVDEMGICANTFKY